MLAQFEIKLSFSPLICSLQSKRSSENLRVHDFGHVQIKMAFSIKRRGADGSHLKPSKHHDDGEATEVGKILKSKVKLLYNNLKYTSIFYQEGNPIRIMFSRTLLKGHSPKKGVHPTSQMHNLTAQVGQRVLMKLHQVVQAIRQVKY